MVNGKDRELVEGSAERLSCTNGSSRFPMLPKFWHDTGNWNDGVVSFFSGLAPLVTLVVVSEVYERPLLGVLLIPVAWICGMILGITTIMILCTFFARNDAAPS